MLAAAGPFIDGESLKDYTRRFRIAQRKGIDEATRQANVSVKRMQSFLNPVAEIMKLKIKDAEGMHGNL